MHEPFIFVGIGIGLGVAAIGELVARFWPWRRSPWIEPTTHDIGILPGGAVIHYSTCWCKSAYQES